MKGKSAGLKSLVPYISGVTPSTTNLNHSSNNYIYLQVQPTFLQRNPRLLSGLSDLRGLRERGHGVQVPAI